jgi:non-heme chloroperoxidase
MARLVSHHAHPDTVAAIGNERGRHIASERVVGSGDVGLHVYVSGPWDGIPVLFLHGQGSSGRVWREVMSGPLAQRARMIAPDYRGHGLSDKPRRGYRASRTWAADVAALVAHFGLDRPVLVGWSYGTAVSCDYLRHGGDARALMLIDGGPEANILDPKIRATIGPDVRDLLRRRLRPGGLSARQLVEASVRLLTERELSTERAAELAEDMRRVRPAAMLAVATRRYQNDDVLRAFRGPILQIHGERDRIRLVHAAERRTALFHDGATEIWPATGHAPFLDEPARFTDSLDAFLTTCEDRAAPTST